MEGPDAGAKVRTNRASKRGHAMREMLLGMIVIAAVTLSACGSERVSQCDPTNTPSANCYRPARPFLNQ